MCKFGILVLVAQLQCFRTAAKKYQMDKSGWSTAPRQLNDEQRRQHVIYNLCLPVHWKKTVGTTKNCQPQTAVAKTSLEKCTYDMRLYYT